MLAYHLARLLVLGSITSLALGNSNIQVVVHPIYSYWNCTIPTVDELFLDELHCQRVCLAGFCEAWTFVPIFNEASDPNVYNLSYPIFVGQSIKITVTPLNSAAISVTQDPGLPIGMQASGTGPINLTWTPRSFAAGHLHTVYAEPSMGRSNSGCRSGFPSKPPT
eukprot:719490-Hanusia_phi.AAC.2